MQPPVEIRYAGVPVARAESVRRPEPSKARVFLVTSDPLPVGTEIELFTDTEILWARVTKVAESADPEKTGMHVLLMGVPDEPEAPPPPAPVVEAAPAVETATAGPESDSEGVPEAVSVETSGATGSGGIEVSEAMDAGEPHPAGESNGTNGAPANGAGKRKRRRRR